MRLEKLLNFPVLSSTDFIEQVMQRPIDDDAKKAHLVALLMDNFTRGALDDFLKDNKNKTTRS